MSGILPSSPLLPSDSQLLDHWFSSSLSLPLHRLRLYMFSLFGHTPVSTTCINIALSPREELLQPVFSAIDSLEFPELHDESIPCLALLHHLTKLMEAAGVKDFGLKVSRPNPIANPTSTMRS